MNIHELTLEQQREKIADLKEENKALADERVFLIDRLQELEKTITELREASKEKDTDDTEPAPAHHDPVTHFFHELESLTYQSPANLVDLMLSKGHVERAAYLEQVRSVIEQMEERVREVASIQTKLALAHQLAQ